MRIFKIILGIIIAFSSLQVFFTDILVNEHGASLYGSIFGLLLILGLSFWLIYSGAQNGNAKLQNNDPSQARDKTETTKSRFASKIENLKSLRDSNVLTESEYQNKIAKINDEQLDERVKKTEEYEKLNKLYIDGVFDKLEFDKNVKKIKEKLYNYHKIENSKQEEWNKPKFEEWNKPKPAEQKNKKIFAGISAILLGVLGIHKFILGYTLEGIIWLVISLCTYGTVTGVLGLIEGIIYLTKSDEEFYQTYQVNKKGWF